MGIIEQLKNPETSSANLQRWKRQICKFLNSSPARHSKALLSLISIIFFAGHAFGKPFITVASTTSTQNSGLYDYILPLFEKDKGIAVRVIAVGTGQAIRIAKNGDADVLIVHHTESEKKFVDSGFGIKRYDLMYNDFVLLGSKTDPARIQTCKSVFCAFHAISKTESIFISRGDNSGTHKMELSIWEKLGSPPPGKSQFWYRETGSGMGASLNIATSLDAYLLSDRATWLKFNNKRNLKILLQNDPFLKNQYGLILVNPKKHPHTKTRLAQTFKNWLLSAQGQQYIAEYTVKGQQAFFPNFKK